MRQFNVYFALAALVLLCGCKTASHNQNDKAAAALRVHLEFDAGDTTGLDTIGTATVLRDNPVEYKILNEPALTEANVIGARIINTPGGFALEIRFDEAGGYILEQDTAANPGKHLLIFGQWGDKKTDGRWLAAQIITHRIANGVLAFTPDMSLDEAEKLVDGLNEIAKDNIDQQLHQSPSQ
ncbi:MAG TPA: hypothetical protein VMB22_09225 [Verrucomicrobiae bacterium]|nr:hypothetical protein [Verrucomicrobiae bacterium]